MKKKDMIKLIQETEAKLFLELKKDELNYGNSHSITSSSRTRWASVFELAENMDIRIDSQSSDNQEATNIIIGNWKKRQDDDLIERLEQADFDSRDINS